MSSKAGMPNQLACPHAKCGATNPRGARNCRRCGRPLAVAETGAGAGGRGATHPPPLSRATPWAARSGGVQTLVGVLALAAGIGVFAVMAAIARHSGQ